jgi:hypothetical protein
MKYKKKSPIRIVVIATAVILCLLPITASKKPPPVAYSVLEQGPDIYYEKTGPEVLIFTEQSSFESFYMQIHRIQAPRPSPPRPDFKNSIVVFFTYGRQKSTGYSIEIVSVYARSSTVVVRSILNTPPAGGFQAQKITCPYMLITIPKDSYRNLQLKDKTGKTIDSAEIPERT